MAHKEKSRYHYGQSEPARMGLNEPRKIHLKTILIGFPFFSPTRSTHKHNICYAHNMGILTTYSIRSFSILFICHDCCIGIHDPRSASIFDSVRVDIVKKWGTEWLLNLNRHEDEVELLLTTNCMLAWSLVAPSTPLPLLPTPYSHYWIFSMSLLNF